MKADATAITQCYGRAKQDVIHIEIQVRACYCCFLMKADAKAITQCYGRM